MQPVPHRQLGGHAIRSKQTCTACAPFCLADRGCLQHGSRYRSAGSNNRASVPGVVLSPAGAAVTQWNSPTTTDVCPPPQSSAQVLPKPVGPFYQPGMSAPYAERLLAQ